MRDLKDKKCLITGAASGIGRSTAIVASRSGARLLLTDIDAGKLKQTVDLIRGNGGVVDAWKPLDISKYDEVKNFADEIHAEFGSIDIVMNIAGISLWGVVELLRHKDWEKVININLMGPIHFIECFIPRMIEAGNGGHLVNVSSAAGLIAFPWHAAYSASKAGLLGLSEVLRYDLMRHDIGVSVICPGAVETPLIKTVELIGIDENHEKIIKLKNRFSHHAISSEKVASIIIKAIQKNTYLVFTSFDTRLLYWLKRRFFIIYDITMKKFSAMANDIMKEVRS